MATVLVPLTTTRHLLQIHWPLFSRRPPVQRGQVVHRPFPAGYCLTPTPELSKTERDPISTIGPSLYSVCHQTGRSLWTDQTFAPHSPPHNLTVLSWLGALYARGTRHACRMASGWNARAPCLEPLRLLSTVPQVEPLAPSPSLLIPRPSMAGWPLSTDDG